MLSLWGSRKGNILPPLLGSRKRFNARLVKLTKDYLKDLDENPFGLKKGLKLRFAGASSVLGPFYDTFVRRKAPEDRYDIFTIGTGGYTEKEWPEKLRSWMQAGVRIHYIIIGEPVIDWVDRLHDEFGQDGLFQVVYVSLVDPETQDFARYYYDYHPTLLVMERQAAERKPEIALWLERYHVDNPENKAEYVEFMPPAYLRSHERALLKAREHLHRMKRMLEARQTLSHVA